MKSHARRDDEREAERPVADARAPADPAAAVLALQRSAGNQAVGAMLARTGEPPVAAKTDEQLYDEAIGAKDYEKAAPALCKLPWSQVNTKLGALDAAALRLLDDALSRMQTGFYGIFTATSVRWLLYGWLTSKGGGATKALPGRQYGELTLKVGTIVNGDKAAGKRYDYPVEITFTPDTTAVNADEIAFIQTVRLVDTKTGADRDWDATNKKRQTASHTSVDRLSGREQGWYGYKDDDSASGTVTPWKKADPTKPAWMSDTPGARIADATWAFETAVVCRSGTDAGTVYATVTWGFTVDSDLKVTALPTKVFNKPTKEFGSAVQKWNDQAAGPEADRNAPGQKSPPALK